MGTPLFNPTRNHNRSSMSINPSHRGLPILRPSHRVNRTLGIPSNHFLRRRILVLAMVSMAARTARLEVFFALLINLNSGVAPPLIYRVRLVIDAPIPPTSRVESDCVGVQATAL
jgi:hypothetical protein